MFRAISDDHPDTIPQPPGRLPDDLVAQNNSATQNENSATMLMNIQTDDMRDVFGNISPIAYVGGSEELRLDSSDLEKMRRMELHLSERSSSNTDSVSPPSGHIQPEVNNQFLGSHLDGNTRVDDTHKYTWNEDLGMLISTGAASSILADVNPNTRSHLMESLLGDPIFGDNLWAQHGFLEGRESSGSYPRIMTPSGTSSLHDTHTHSRHQESSGGSSSRPGILTPSGDTSLGGVPEASSQNAPDCDAQQVLGSDTLSGTYPTETKSPELLLPSSTKTKARKRRYASEELDKVNSVRASSACIRCQVMREAVRCPLISVSEIRSL